MPRSNRIGSAAGFLPDFKSEMKVKAKFDDVTAVILAGGRSSRMGRDKALLEVAGVPLIARILRVMRDSFTTFLISGDRPDLAEPAIPYYADRFPGSALGGIYTGLIEAETPYIFVSACDMPYPDPHLIREIVGRREGNDAVVPRTGQYREPLFALYSKSCMVPIQNMLENNNYRIQNLYEIVKVMYLDFEEMFFDWKKALMNVNTPREYASIT